MDSSNGPTPVTIDCILRFDISLFFPFQSLLPSIVIFFIFLPFLFYSLLLLFPLPLPLLLHCITQVSQCTRLLQSIVIFSAFLLPPSSSSSILRLSSSKVCYNRKAAKQREDFSMRHLQTKKLPWFHIPMKTHPPKSRRESSKFIQVVSMDWCLRSPVYYVKRYTEIAFTTALYYSRLPYWLAQLSSSTLSKART